MREINNISLFLIGIVITILGTFIVVFDYPQIQYFDSIESESYLRLDEQQKDIHQRLEIEFGIGIVILGIGIGLIFVSIFKKSKK